MKIAICDDDKTEQLQILELLEEYFKEGKNKPTIKTFSSSIELASIARYEQFDLYLLDVIMPVLNGIELAKEIRGFDKVSDIIFLTSSPEFAVESYTVKAANYLVKPIQKAAFFQALDDISEKRMEESGKSIIVKSSFGVHKIYLSGLIYVEAMNRKVIYYLKNGEQITTAERFSSVCDILMQNSEFILPHRSFLVNMNYIRSITTTDMHLQNNKIIPLAQRRVADIKKHYLAFQMEEVSP